MTSNEDDASSSGTGGAGRRRARPIRARRFAAAVAASIFATLALSSFATASQTGAADQVQTLIRAGKYTQAEQSARVLLSEAEQAHGVASLEVAEILDRLVDALRREGRAGEAETRAFCDRAIQIKESMVGANDSRYAASLFQSGMLSYSNGDYLQAKAIFARVLAIREAALGADNADVATTLLYLAGATAEGGDANAARPLLERALAIREATFGPESTEVAECLNAMAGMLLKVGEFSAAQPTFERALDIYEKAADRGHEATCLNNIAAVLYLTGDYSGALAYHQRSLAIRTRVLGPNHELVADAMANIGVDLAALGRVSEARGYFQRALSLQETRYGQDSGRLGWTQAKLGMLYLQSGDYRHAKPMLERAAANLKAGFGPEHPDYAEALAALATASAAEGDTTASKNEYEQAIRIQVASLGADHPDVGLMYTQYARLLAASGQDSTALSFALHGEDISREHLRLMSRSLPERQALSYAAARPAGGRVALSILAGTPNPTPATVSRVCDALIRSRMLVLDEMASRARSMAEVGDSASIRLLEDLAAARRRFANLLVAGSQGESVEQYRSAVDRARSEAEDAERALAERSAAFRQQQAQGRIGLAEVASSLPSGSALVAYATAGDSASLSYVAFVLAGRDAAPQIVRIGRAARIQSAVSRWLEAISHGGPAVSGDAGRTETSSRALGADLERLIWNPLSPRIGAAKRVFVVPDGAINLVNFAALPTGRDRYLVEEGYVFHYLSAERDLVQDSAPSHEGTGLLAIGDPAFNAYVASGPSRDARIVDTAGPGGASPGRRGADPDWQSFQSIRFPPLPGTGREVREVAALWADPDHTALLTGAAASEAAFKAAAPGLRVVHLATHGFFLGDDCTPGSASTRGIGTVSPATRQAKPENPLLLSGLAFAGANRRSSARPDEENGILTAEEISTLNLAGVDWAVLSACDTGKGRIQAGEGVLGLRRAFQIAGARTVIMSLWSVEDDSARRWMKALYEGRVEGGLDTADAVAKATLSVLREQRAQARSTDPFYWAAFVAAGDWK